MAALLIERKKKRGEKKWQRKRLNWFACLDSDKSGRFGMDGSDRVNRNSATWDSERVRFMWCLGRQALRQGLGFYLFINLQLIVRIIITLLLLASQIHFMFYGLVRNIILTKWLVLLWIKNFVFWMKN